ncbi:pleckstrin homology domain-containing family M member 2 isoform X2 [Trichomycterus rosablanca]|uniref:pleckstrin homology domain-containing family M member 2 isoform X2 n=1 Tax=Trichomycterus rosablanca TaxID=2290929 RepID=UPI002F3543F2
MDQLKVKDRILENISLSVKKLQSYFAACEDETPAIRNHDRVLQRLCEHLDHALLYGLQDISSGYWVLVLHFTRREAVRQIDELQHIATNLGRSRAWLYLALSESSLESYLRLFQENQALLHKYYLKNALVCSHDHLTLFLTLVSGLEFIRFDLELDVPYLDVAPYMPDYYKPQNLLDFEERLPSSDSISLHSFTSLTSTNLEWDDSAIAPSSEEGDLTDPVSGSRSTASELHTVVSGESVVVKAAETSVRIASLSYSPTNRYNPFNEDSDSNTSADVTPVHTASRRDAPAGDDTESTSTDLEVIRMVRRKKPGKKRRGKGSTNSIGSIHSLPSPEQLETEESIQTRCERTNAEDGVCYDTLDTLNGPVQSDTELRESGEDEEPEAMLRLPEMTDTSMDSVGKPLWDVMDRLNGALDGKTWERQEKEEAEGEMACANPAASLLQQQPFQEDAPGEPPDPESQLHALASPAPAHFYCFTSQSAGAAAQSGSHHDSAGHGQSEALLGGHEDERKGETAAEQDASSQIEKDRGEAGGVLQQNGSVEGEVQPDENSHPAEFRVDNNHLLLLMIHVFRENEEQLIKMVRMSTGHMEGDLQPLFLLLTDCYIYLLRKGAADKPYTVEDAVSYTELDYISVGLDLQTITLVCTNRRRQFLLDTADCSLTIWFLGVLKPAITLGCREEPYPAILTDATMEKLALTKFAGQECNCEVSEVSVRLYSLIHWEDPMDVCVSSPTSPSGSRVFSSTKEGTLQYRVGTSYLGKELWKSCYLVLSNGILYQYPDRTDVTPLMSITMGGEHCGGCRRSNSTERPHAFQVILTARPPLELCAENELDMAEWMQLICQAVSKGMIPQGVAPVPCIPCCLVLTDKKLLTCHQDCQTSFFRSLGAVNVSDITAVRLEEDKEYCVIEFAADRSHYLPSWVLYFSGCSERDRLLEELNLVWTAIFQVSLARKVVSDELVQKRCREALELMHSAWKRSDSLRRGRCSREPWC